jgi:uroporphyrinogen-III decarboxylase
METDGSLSGDHLAGMDFDAHNKEVRGAWYAYNAGRPYRVPVTLGINVRYFLSNPEANTEGVDFRLYSEDPDVMFDTQLRFQRWVKFNLLHDAQLGLPKTWQVNVDFQNYYEAAWFGCPILYIEDQVPDTHPAFRDEPERVLEKGVPDPFGGLMARGLEYYERFRKRAENETYLDRPIEVTAGSGCGTDGIMTAACNLFGPEFVCVAMLTEPERIHRLLEFITEAMIARMTAWREKMGIPVPQDGFGYADDSIALLSVDMFREHVLPYHRRLCDALATEKPRSIHLCGDATRHFVTLRDELNIVAFDTGFPVDFAQLRRDLGPEVRIQGGPHADFLRTATPDAVREEVKRILFSGVLRGGLFVLREGNNLAPGTPVENIEAMYHAGRQFGKLPE